MADPTPTLTDEQREELARMLCASDGVSTPDTWQHLTDWRRDRYREQADALAPLIARMVADAERRALREAAEESHQRGDIGKDGGVEAWVWLNKRADRIGGGS